MRYHFVLRQPAEMNKLLYLFLTSPASSKRVTFDEGNFIATDSLDNDCDGFVLEDLVQVNTLKQKYIFDQNIDF